MDNDSILNEIRYDVKELREDFQNFKLNASLDLVRIQEKNKASSKIWGLVGGLLPAIGILIFELLK